jgi:hypothetical protein
MPTRKQRRRRAKERRHDYEYVYVEVDEEGREVEVEVDGDEVEEKSRRNGRAPRPVTRSGRVVEPPSWRRVAKRGLLFAPLMFLTITLIDSGTTMSVRIVNTLMLLAFFLPFSYLMDRMLYRASVRRAGLEKDRGRA